MQTLEYDYTDHIRPNAGDDSLLVKFYMDAAQDMVASKAAGRPVFKDIEWIDIRIPGNRDNIVIRPVRPEDTQRFPRHYQAFKNRIATGGKESEIGTPLSAWPYAGLTPARVKELDFFNIRTVEQLAGTSDGTGAKMPGFQAMKQAAVAYLEIAKQQEPVRELQKQLDDMNAIIKKQAAMIERLSETPKDSD